MNIPADRAQEVKDWLFDPEQGGRFYTKRSSMIEHLGDATREVERLRLRADDLIEQDNAYWEAVATGQDSEEAEHSGYLEGLRAGFDLVIKLLGGTETQALIEDHFPPERS